MNDFTLVEVSGQRVRFLYGDVSLDVYIAIKDDMTNAGGIWSDNEVVIDGNLITSRKPDDLPAFCKAILSVSAH